MALSELNPRTKQDMISMIRSIANEVDRSILRWKEFKAFLDTYTDQELLDLTFSQDSVNNIRAMGIALLNMEEAYENREKTQTGDPSYTIELLKDAVTF
jgi:hypothetical protein